MGILTPSRLVLQVNMVISKNISLLTGGQNIHQDCCCLLWSLSSYTAALPDAWYHRHLSLAGKTNFLRPQAQEGSSHRHVPDPCLASDLEHPELSCAGATPEVTAELLLVYGSQDFPPSKPHLWDVRESCSQICDELRRSLYETSRDNCAKSLQSLQSCPTLCDPIDGSPPGSPVPGILQAKTLEWIAISFSRDNCTILKITTRGQQNPRVQVRRMERSWNEEPGRPHSRQEG